MKDASYCLSLGDIQKLLIEEHLLLYVKQAGEKVKKIDRKEENRKKIKHISYDSRTLTEDSLFICKGASFKRQYLLRALEQGLSYYMSEVDYDIKRGTAFIVSDIRKSMAVISQAFYAFPDLDLNIVGITATKGKTTTCYYTKDILEANFPNQVAFISGEEMSLDGKNFKLAKLSTPESLDLYQYLAQARDLGKKYLVLEISSQAFMLDRVYGLHLEVGIFMNISEDHVSPEEHKSLDEYFDCKRQIINHSRWVILSSHLPRLAELKNQSKKEAESFFLYGKNSHHPDLDYCYQAIDSTNFMLETCKKDPLSIAASYKLAMPGIFNMDNACAALMAAGLLGSQVDKSQAGLAQSRVPGRMESYRLEKGSWVIIDFAHNQASLEAILSYVKTEYPKHKSSVVIGSQSHRSELRWIGIAQVLSKYGDKVYLTADDPGYMSVEDISHEIAKRITSDIEIIIIPDREEAIMTALDAAQADEVIILAGKGTETSQFIDGKSVDYIGDKQCLLNYMKG